MTIIEISCVHVWREISNYVDDDIDPVLRDRIAEHLKSCAHCSAIVNGTRNLIGLVGDGKSLDLPTGFSERLKSRITENTGSSRK